MNIRNMKASLKLIEDNYKIVVILFFISFLIIGILIYNDYGLSLDEASTRNLGVMNWDFIKGENEDLLSHRSRYHGPVFQIFLIFVEYSMDRFLGLKDSRDIYFARHLFTFLLFYTSTIFFYLLCKRKFHSWKLALLGGLFLILSPRIFAHSFYNSKDLVFLSMFIISIYTLVKYLDKKTLNWSLIHALTCAILIDIRVVGIVVPFFTFVFIMGDLFFLKLSKSKIRKILASMLVYIIFLVFLTILFWPVLWVNPLYHFLRALLRMGKYPWPGSNLYFGEFVKAINLPWHYILVWLIITTPVLYVFLFFIGLVSFIKKIYKRFRRASNNLEKYDLIIFLWFFLPLIAVIILKSVLYDGWRHMFFIYPAFLIMSLQGLSSLFRFIKLRFTQKARKFAYAVLIFIILVSLVSTAYFMVKNHPYQNVYFNKLAGRNDEEIKNNFELDYWGLSYRRALESILENDKRGIIKINVATYPGKLNYEILNSTDKSRLKYVENRSDADYFLSNYRYRNPKKEYPYENEFYSIYVGDMKIMVVYKFD